MARKLRADDHCRTAWVRRRAHGRAANRRDADHVEPRESHVIPQRFDRVETGGIVYYESTVHGARQQNESV
jgi:hypothetical protein